MISFIDISKTFYPQNIIFDNLNFDINDGEFIFLTGVSGSGKTTLLNLLLRTELPDNGDIIFQGQSLNALKKRHLPLHRRQIGVVFQDYKLINDLTIAENIALPLAICGLKKSEINQRVGELLTLINMSERATHFPKQLSGGEAQRVGIARSLATAPKIIFADEPTGNLDYKSTLGIAKLLEKINQLGTTIIVSTHDPLLLDIISHARHLHIQDKSLIDCPCCSSSLRNLVQKQASSSTTVSQPFKIQTENLADDLSTKVNNQKAISSNQSDSNFKSKSKAVTTSKKSPTTTNSKSKSENSSTSSSTSKKSKKETKKEK